MTKFGAVFTCIRLDYWIELVKRYHFSSHTIGLAHTGPRQNRGLSAVTTRSYAYAYFGQRFLHELAS